MSLILASASAPARRRRYRLNRVQRERRTIAALAATALVVALEDVLQPGQQLLREVHRQRQNLPAGLGLDFDVEDHRGCLILDDLLSDRQDIVDEEDFVHRLTPDRRPQIGAPARRQSRSSKGSRTNTVSSRSGLVENSATGASISSSMRRIYLMASALSCAQERAPRVLSLHPSTVS